MIGIYHRGYFNSGIAEGSITPAEYIGYQIASCYLQLQFDPITTGLLINTFSFELFGNTAAEIPTVTVTLGGAAAVICDPVVGDIGLAVFAKQDVSNVDVGITEPVQPGTFRMFDISDGFYVGGFLNKTPSCYIQVLPDGNINITGPSQVTVNTANTLINSNTTITGNLTVQGNIKAQQRLDVTTGASIAGIEFGTHRHVGVDTGSGTSGGPV